MSSAPSFANSVNCTSAFEYAVTTGGWRLRASSIAVYRSMWRKFENVAHARGIDEMGPTSSELEELVHRAYPDSANTANKLFRVVLKVYEHAGTQGAAGYAAAKDIEYRFFDKAPVVRTAFEAPSATLEASASGWKKLRMSALQALVNVAAPRLGELQELRYKDVACLPDKVKVSLGRGRSKRVIDVLAASVEAAAIAAYHAAHPSPASSSRFLCSDSEGSPLNAATIYRQLKALTASAGAQPEHHGSGAYRANLARKLLEEGKSVEDIRAALGHRLAASTEEFLKNVQVAEETKKT